MIAGRTGPISFNWGSFAWSSSPPLRTDRTLIYDASGETAMKAKREKNDGNETLYMLWHFFLNENSAPGD